MLHWRWPWPWLWLWLWLWLLLPLSILGALQPVERERPTELIYAALHVVEHCMNPSHNVLAIMELSHSDLEHRDQHLIMTYLLQQLSERMSVQLMHGKPVEQPHDFMVFMLDHPTTFRELRFHFAKGLFDREFNFMIVLRWRPPTQQALLNGLQQIFRLCLNFHVLHAVVLVQPSWIAADEVLIYGYRLYSINCRESFTPELINRYRRGQLLESGPLFGRPLLSLFDCPLNVSWYPLPPYVLFDGDSSNSQHRMESWRLSGVDGELIKLLSQIFHFRPYLLPPCQKKSLNLPMNNSIADCFEQLATKEAAVAIGAMSGSHMQREKFSTTSAYHQDALVFIVRFDSEMGAVSQLVQPFCCTVWLALSLSCIALLLLQWVWRPRREPFDLVVSGLRVHTTLLGNPLEGSALPRDGTVRLYLGGWLLLALVQRAAYQGKLYDAFREPYYPPVPEHIAQLLDGDYQYLMMDYVDYFPEKRTILNNSSIMERFHKLEVAKEGARLTTSALLGNLAHYNQLNWQTSRLTHVREHIYLYQLVMYLNRHSVLKFPFDRKLKQLQSAGIIGYMNQYFERRIYHNPYTSSYEVSPVRMDMLCGLLFICYLMLSVALIAFLLERASLRFLWLQRFFA